MIFAIFVVSALSAQSKWKLWHHKADSLLAARYSRVTYDTTYIGRPDSKFTVKFRVNVSGNQIKSDGESMGVSYNSKLSTDTRMTVSAGVIYRGLGISLALNPAKLGGKDKDIETNIVYTSSRVSLDATYQASKTLSGDFESGGETVHLVPVRCWRVRVINTTGSRVLAIPTLAYRNCVHSWATLPSEPVTVTISSPTMASGSFMFPHCPQSS